jgi:hypothetical protein
LKSRFSERIVKRGLPVSNSGHIRANLLRFPECSGLGEQPTDARLLKSLESFTLNPPPLGLFASFLRSNLLLPFDHPFTMVRSTGTADTLAVNDDCNGNVSEPRL